MPQSAVGVVSAVVGPNQGLAARSNLHASVPPSAASPKVPTIAVSINPSRTFDIMPPTMGKPMTRISFVLLRLTSTGIRLINLAARYYQRVVSLHIKMLLIVI